MNGLPSDTIARPSLPTSHPERSPEILSLRLTADQSAAFADLFRLQRARTGGAIIGVAGCYYSAADGGPVAKLELKLVPFKAPVKIAKMVREA